LLSTTAWILLVKPPRDLRQTVIFALRLMGGRLPNFAAPAPDADASLLKLPPPKIIFWAATPAPGLRPLV